MIQPHLPVRLPCYDLTLVTVLTAYNGSLTGLFVRPMSWVIWALIILSVVYAVLDNRKAKRQEKELSGKQ